MRAAVYPAVVLAVLFSIFLVGAAPAGAGSFRVESRLTPGVVAVDGAVLFTIEVAGPGIDQPRLRPRFELVNLELVGVAEPTHDITFGAGGVEWRYAWTWRLRPLELGPAAVVGVHLLIGERAVDLAPQRLEVVAELPPGAPGAGRPDPWADRASPRSPLARFEDLIARSLERYRGAPPAGAGERPDLFLRAVASPERPYAGQRVVYTLWLYTRVPVRAMEPESLPSFEGLWARHVDNQLAAHERAEWQGEAYNRVPLLRKELFPLGSAPRVVEPARVRFVVERLQRDRIFFAPVQVPAEVVRESNPVALEVRPLPPLAANAGAAFGGAVGELTLAAVLQPTEVAVDQGATLTVTAAGDGHLEAMPPPPVRAPAGVEVIGPQSGPFPADEPDTTERTWSYLLVPREPGSWRLPAIEVPYFDPGAGEYRLARATLPELVARPAGEGGAGVGAEGEVGGAVGAAADLDSSRSSRPGAWWSAAAPSLSRTLPWALALPALALLAAVLLRRRRRGRGGAGGRGGRHGELQALRRGLDAARAEERPRRAAAAIERAWRSFLAETRDLPEAVPPARWPDELRQRGAPPEACRGLAKLLEDLHYLRFAPELSATATLAGELAERSLRLADEL